MKNNVTNDIVCAYLFAFFYVWLEINGNIFPNWQKRRSGKATQVAPTAKPIGKDKTAAAEVKVNRGQGTCIKHTTNAIILAICLGTPTHAHIHRLCVCACLFAICMRWTAWPTRQIDLLRAINYEKNQAQAHKHTHQHICIHIPTLGQRISCSWHRARQSGQDSCGHTVKSIQKKKHRQACKYILRRTQKSGKINFLPTTTKKNRKQNSKGYESKQAAMRKIWLDIDCIWGSNHRRYRRKKRKQECLSSIQWAERKIEREGGCMYKSEGESFTTQFHNSLLYANLFDFLWRTSSILQSNRIVSKSKSCASTLLFMFQGHNQTDVALVK